MKNCIKKKYNSKR